MIQLLRPVEWLPPFAAWQSGALPYGVLVGAQLAILAWGAHVLSVVGRGRRAPRRGMWFLVLGVCYATMMFIRLVGGWTFAADHPWFQARIPTFFHFVLAGFVITLGRYHLGGRER